MRIAISFFLPKPPITGVFAVIFAVFGILCFTPISVHAVQAAEPGAEAPVALPEESSQPAFVIPAEESLPVVKEANAATPESAPPQSPEATSAPVASVPSLGAPAQAEVLSQAPSAPEGVKAQDGSIRKNITAMENKAISNAKSVIKRLDVGSDATTLEDLNTARQTVTRIEAMIELEKRLKELEKLRGESRMVSMPQMIEGAIPSSAFISQIPASSLTAPPALPEPGMQNKSTGSSSRPEIAQIIGTEGKYSAVLKFLGKEERTVKIGDKINDDETVRAITPSSVDIGDKKASYTLHVKNIGIITSAMR